jgi:hypothetical protein
MLKPQAPRTSNTYCLVRYGIHQSLQCGRCKLSVHDLSDDRELEHAVSPRHVNIAVLCASANSVRLIGMIIDVKVGSHRRAIFVTLYERFIERQGNVSATQTANTN